MHDLLAEAELEGPWSRSLERVEQMGHAAICELASWQKASSSAEVMRLLSKADTAAAMPNSPRNPDYRQEPLTREGAHSIIMLKVRVRVRVRVRGER